MNNNNNYKPVGGRTSVQYCLSELEPKKNTGYVPSPSIFNAPDLRDRKGGILCKTPPRRKDFFDIPGSNSPAASKHISGKMNKDSIVFSDYPKGEPRADSLRSSNVPGKNETYERLRSQNLCSNVFYDYQSDDMVVCNDGSIEIKDIMRKSKITPTMRSHADTFQDSSLSTRETFSRNESKPNNTRLTPETLKEEYKINQKRLEQSLERPFIEKKAYPTRE